MHFLNPAALFGLAAALIPLAIHLLHRGRSRPVPFSNLRFLRRLDQNRMRRIRLRQWLALLLRTLIIALIVAAFARPAYQHDSGWGGQSPPVAAAVLVDISYSTGFRLGGTPLFAAMQRQAQAIVGLFSPRDRVWLVPFAGQAQTLDANTPERLTEAVSGLAPTEEGTDLAAALAEAARVLGQAGPDAEPELYLVTDLARNDWPEVPSPVALPGRTRVFVAAPEAPERPNRSVDGVRSLSWMAAAGQGMELEVTVSNHATRTVEGIGLDLYLDGERVGHQEISLAASDQSRVRFRVTPRRAGRLAGFAELEEDGLTVDNRCAFTLDLPEKVVVKIIGPSPADTYYPDRGLAAAAGADPALRISTLPLADLQPAALAGVDVVLIAGMEQVTPTQAGYLRGYVTNGGGLGLFPGPGAGAGPLGVDLLSGLAPLTVGGVAGTPGQQDAYQQLDARAPHNPLFDDLFSGPAESQPRFFAWRELQPGQDTEVWARLAGGQPLAVSAAAGAGRVVVVAVPLSMAWTDLPLRGAFVPLLHRLTRELCLGVDHYLTYRVGGIAERRPPRVALAPPLEAEAPSGATFLLAPEPTSGAPRWRTPRLNEAGLWRLRQGDQVVDQFAVDLDPRESTLTPVDPGTVSRVLGSGNLVYLEPGKDPAAAVAAARTGRELWRELLLLAVALLLVELWIARAPRDRDVAEASAP